jgi:hypothetical protein
MSAGIVFFGIDSGTSHEKIAAGPGSKWLRISSEDASATIGGQVGGRK